MKKNKNQETANRLDEMKGLTQKSIDAINTTCFQCLDELFGHFRTAEEVNAYVDEYYDEEDFE